MKINTAYYVNFGSWAGQKVLQLAAGDPVKLAVFLNDLHRVGDAALDVLHAFPEGGSWKRAPAWIAWALSHPDPLRDLRFQMEAVQTKWGDHG